MTNVNLRPTLWMTNANLSQMKDFDQVEEELVNREAKL